jgi:hypothetical protein
VNTHDGVASAAQLRHDFDLIASFPPAVTLPPGADISAFMLRASERLPHYGDRSPEQVQQFAILTTLLIATLCGIAQAAAAACVQRHVMRAARWRAYRTLVAYEISHKLRRVNDDPSQRYAVACAVIDEAVATGAAATAQLMPAKGTI